MSRRIVIANQKGGVLKRRVAFTFAQAIASRLFALPKFICIYLE